jgi:hypothetical protein
VIAEQYKIADAEVTIWDDYAENAKDSKEILKKAADNLYRYMYMKHQMNTQIPSDSERD